MVLTPESLQPLSKPPPEPLPLKIKIFLFIARLFGGILGLILVWWVAGFDPFVFKICVIVFLGLLGYLIYSFYKYPTKK
ncbi:MAG TPA: hypothetical protein VMW81_08785 [Nitrospinota bacterium]|nr:hypothetical protein [Nitrospinota bacterium]